MSALHLAVRRGSSQEVGLLLERRRSEGGSSSRDLDSLDDVRPVSCPFYFKS